MASKDLKNDIFQCVALDFQTINSDTTTVGNIIDTQGYEGLTFIFLSGTLTDGAYLPLIEDGDNDALGDAAVVTDTFLLGTEAEAAFALADDNETTRIGYVGKKRYVRVSLVSSATSSGGGLGCIAVKSSWRNNATA